jgi:hypothetical protein
VNNDEDDYLEIDELVSHLHLHNEVGVPVNESVENMGQISAKKAKISFTSWINSNSHHHHHRHHQSQPQQQRPQSQSPIKSSFNWNDVHLFRKKSHEKLFSEKDENGLKLCNEKLQPSHDRVKKFSENFCHQRKSPTESNYDRLHNKSMSQVNLSMNNHQPLYITTQSDSGIKRGYRRRRKRSPKFGYNIKNVNDFLSKCSLNNPANIPVVLSATSILYQTRTGKQVETSLPLGMVVNSIFKNQDWLYGEQYLLSNKR